MHRRLFVPVVTATIFFSAGSQAEEPAVQHLAEALRFETVSHQDRGRIDGTAFNAFLEFARARYPRVFSMLEVETVNTYSLLMRWPGQQSDAAPVLFDAHYDVVPIEPGTEADWTHPPFSGAIADGYVWGRGALDDKIAVIITLEAIEQLLVDGYAPERTLYFSFVHDEEIGGEEGAGEVVKTLQARGVEFEYVVGEGGGVISNYPMLPGQTVGMIALAEKSYLTLTLKATGTGGHSSSPPRDSSIVRLAKALTTLHENPFPAEIVPPVDQMLSAVGEHQEGLLGFALRNQWLTAPIILSQLGSEGIGAAMVRTTTAVTMINAGVKENVVPQRAEAMVNFRVLPGTSPEEVIADVERMIDDPQIEIVASPWNGNAGIADVEGEGYRRVRAALEAAVPEVVVIPGLLMATTDSRHYSAVAPNIYRFHPMNLDVEDAGGVHGTNERIPIDGIHRGLAIYLELIPRVGAR
jgi:carboxypeptidase PM20D1